MSWAALAWAGKCKPGSASRKLVLFALADRHNEEVDGAYPSIAWMVEFTGLNRKTIITCLAELEAQGLISDTGDRRGDTRQIKLYRLHLETIPKAEQSQKRNSSEKYAEQSQKRDTDTVRTSSSTKASPSKRKRFPAPAGVSDDIWQDFLASPKRRKAGMSDTAYSGIKNNLRALAEHGFPPGEMISLAVERGWVTVKLEWVRENGRTNGDRGGGGRMGGPRPDPTLALVRSAIAAQREDVGDYREARPALPPGKQH